MQRRNQAEIRCPVILQNLLVTVVAVQEDDGLPIAGLEAAVDAFRFLNSLRPSTPDSAGFECGWASRSAQT